MCKKNNEIVLVYSFTKLRRDKSELVGSAEKEINNAVITALLVDSIVSMEDMG